MLRDIFFIVLLLTISLSCLKVADNEEIPVTFELIESWPLDIEDPSGLSRSHLPDHFYTVSDKSGNVYLITNKGEIVDILPMNGDDLEGIEYVAEKDRLYIVEERRRWVVSLTRQGEALDTFRLMDIPVQNLNDGPEGIAWHTELKQFFIVNEKNPSTMFVYDSLFNLISSHNLNFAQDYSSVDYDEHTGHLWILSDQSKMLARCNVKGQPDKFYYTNLPKGEGVVVDSRNNRVYIVCDESETLYVFSLP